MNKSVPYAWYEDFEVDVEDIQVEERDEVLLVVPGNNLEAPENIAQHQSDQETYHHEEKERNIVRIIKLDFVGVYQGNVSGVPEVIGVPEDSGVPVVKRFFLRLDM